MILIRWIYHYSYINIEYRFFKIEILINSSSIFVSMNTGSTMFHSKKLKILKRNLKFHYINDGIIIRLYRITLKFRMKRQYINYKYLSSYHHITLKNEKRQKKKEILERSKKV